MNPWLSVIMPTYNGATYLGAAVRSFFAQGGRDHLHFRAGGHILIQLPDDRRCCGGCCCCSVDSLE